MTASMPVPHDAFPPRGEGARAEGVEAPVVPIASAAGSAPRTPKRLTPRRPAKAPAQRAASADPGPPPPLPPDLTAPAPAAEDLVIPPRPPLPGGAGDESGHVEAPGAAEDEVDIAPEVIEPVIVADEPEAEAPETEPELETEPDLAESEPDLAETEPDLAESEPDLAESDPSSVVAEPETSTSAVPQGSAIDELLAVALADGAVDGGEQHPDPFAESVTLDEDPYADEEHAVLVVRGLTKSFGETRAVDGIDLTVPAGTFYGIVGPNGAGKTTTLSLISGLLRADKGSVRVNGLEVRSRPARAQRHMGVLPDRLRTFDRLTGRQLLYYYGVLRGLSGAVVENRIADLARAFDLTDSLGRVVSDYSAGMVKKIMLAGALIHAPRLLVLDEPFESVDPVSSAVILDILSAYVAHGGTVILSSHGMEFVERVCTRVAVIVAGQVLAEGTIAQVRGELTLEQRFVELAGGLSDVEGLEWLHTFSD